jgi:hypothetical protein
VLPIAAVDCIFPAVALAVVPTLILVDAGAKISTI